MEMIWFLALYIGVLGAFLFIMLFGESATFQGTIVERLHFFVTTGSCDMLRNLVGMAFGVRGVAACDWLGDFCCNKPNPILQLFYVSLLAVSYYSYSSFAFAYIPGPFLSSVHRYTGPLAVVACLALFYATSFSDPGTVTARNVARHQAAFPYDDQLYREKPCRTCRLPRPARSKHCSICGRCIARFDHHCGWMNNCVGENNVRYFVAFLLGHTLLCLYGAIVLAAVLAGEVHTHGLVEAITEGRVIEPSPGKWGTLSLVLQWLLVYHSVLVMLLVFSVVICCLLAGFSAYHLYLIYINVTTNETYKWADLKRRLAHEQAAELAATSAAGALAGESTAGASANISASSEGQDEMGGPTAHSEDSGGGWPRRRLRRSVPDGADPLRPPAAPEERPRSDEGGSASSPGLPNPKNVYDRGLWENLVEVVNPRSHRQGYSLSFNRRHKMKARR